eukprot:6514234-Prymnesium_polylepis.1
MCVAKRNVAVRRSCERRWQRWRERHRHWRECSACDGGVRTVVAALLQRTTNAAGAAPRAGWGAPRTPCKVGARQSVDACLAAWSAAALS